MNTPTTQHVPTYAVQLYHNGHYEGTLPEEFTEAEAQAYVESYNRLRWLDGNHAVATKVCPSSNETAGGAP